MHADGIRTVLNRLFYRMDVKGEAIQLRPSIATLRSLHESGGMAGGSELRPGDLSSRGARPRCGEPAAHHVALETAKPPAKGKLLNGGPLFLSLAMPEIMTEQGRDGSPSWPGKSSLPVVWKRPKMGRI